MPEIGAGEFITIALLVLFIFGPDKLPKLAADAGRLLRDVRRYVAKARSELNGQLGPEFEGLDLADLNPRTFVRKNLLGEDETTSGATAWEPRDEPGSGATAWQPNGADPGEPALAEGETPPYDLDAT